MATNRYQKRAAIGVIDRLLYLLSRNTSSGMVIAQLEGLRFVALLLVFLGHINSYLAHNSDRIHQFYKEDIQVISSLILGDNGVQLFFAVSGFILGLPFARHYLQQDKKVVLPDYYKRRVRRLEPPYIINLCLALIGIALTKETALTELIPHFFASIFYLHNLVYNKYSIINQVTWSLEVEIQFYLIVPLLVLIFKIRPTWLRRCLIVLTAYAAVLSQIMFPNQPVSIFKELQFFLVGFIAVDIYLENWKSKLPSTHVADIVGVFSTIVFLWFTPNNNLGLLITPLLLFGSFLGLMCGRTVNRLLTNRWIVTIGGMCYTIYLYHFILISVLGRVTCKFLLTKIYIVDFMLQSLIIATLSAIPLCLLFLMFEKPFMNKKKSYHENLEVTAECRQAL